MSRECLESEGIMVYPEAVPVLEMVDNCSSALVHWMAHRMNDDNVCRLNADDKREFISIRVGDPWSYRTLNNAIYQLKNVEAIALIRKKFFIVNPKYFCKSTNKGLRVMLFMDFQEVVKINNR